MFDTMWVMSETAIIDLGEQIATLAADLDSLDGRQLATRLQDLERVHRRVERAIVGVVRAADQRGVWAEDGHRSVVAGARRRRTGRMVTPLTGCAP